MITFKDWMFWNSGYRRVAVLITEHEMLFIDFKSFGKNLSFDVFDERLCISQLGVEEQTGLSLTNQ